MGLNFPVNFRGDCNCDKIKFKDNQICLELPRGVLFSAALVEKNNNQDYYLISLESLHKFRH